MKKALLPLILLAALSARAQENIPFDKRYFPDDKEGFKEARRNLKLGDVIFEEQNTAYFNQAIAPYLAAHAFNPNNAELNYKLGVSYLYSATKAQSLKFLEKSYALDSEFDAYNIHYLLGRGHHLNGRWEEAGREYEKQLGTLRRMGGDPEEFAIIEKLLKEVENGKVLTQTKERVWIDNLGPAINSAAPEYAPLISTDESLMILTARRDGGVGGLIDDLDNRPYEDLYFSRNLGGVWTPLANMGEVINGTGHDAGSGLSPDGKTLFIFRGNSRGGDIHYSKLENGQWTKPRDLGKNINSDAHESAAALSFDGRFLYFVSERKGGYGGKDIYVSTWNEIKKEWGEARNLGPEVNSPYDEDGVYIHPDGKTLYFSSKGHNTMGGSDIFYTENKSGVWTTPVNIGHPINTPDDDVFFVMAADGRTAYYSSIREEGYGEKDIYRITFLGPEKQPVLNVDDRLIAGSELKSPQIAYQPAVKIRTSKMVLLKGLVIDEKTKEPVEATIDLIDNTTSGVLATFKTEETTGKYLVSLPAGKNYGLNVNADGYLFHSMNFNLPDTATYREYYKVIELKKIKIGESIVLRNIFFDYDKATIRSESEAELERLRTLMVENPQISVEISGHTDDVGSEAYNMKLSEERAQAVSAYLTDKGVDNHRMISKGYGKTKPIATNETPEGRTENRRTEFTIIE